MTDREYREHPGISRSQLVKIGESPEKFKYYMENPEQPTPSLIFGQLFHAMVLQPENVVEEFCVAPDVDRRTKAGKEAYAQFMVESATKTVVSMEMMEQACAMSVALHGNEFVRKLLDGEKEVPFFWNDEMTGEQCKCRVDCLSQIGDIPVVVDLKTTDNAETDAFMRSAVKYGYDFQTAMYLEGVKKNTGKYPIFVFIAIEKKPPYAINIMQADKVFIQRGCDLFREYIGIYHDCKQTGNWYGYLGKYNQINNLALPSYLAKEIE